MVYALALCALIVVVQKSSQYNCTGIKSKKLDALKLLLNLKKNYYKHIGYLFY